ncbi:hypothetical protein B0T10DRAFT_466149 [Thelonectria olida]|uniref:Uncharacterized protein n=1 Tax=Thelonectria olida TaxID=1576542 RepID=A0A9P8VR38_9HYPO|nr:hypothetical protein B0T10DRAFT_466149 [Thelonectria olida]
MNISLVELRSIPAAVASRVEFKSASVDYVTEAVLNQSAPEIRADAGEITRHNLMVLGRRAALQPRAGKLPQGLQTGFRSAWALSQRFLWRRRSWPIADCPSEST